jgi:hypothetical protein
MRPTMCVAAAAAAVVTAACGGSPYVGLSTITRGPDTTTVTSLVAQASAADAYLRGLVPTPATTNRTDGPDSIHDGGIHLHFWAAGSPADVLGAYKAALLDGHWTLIVDSSSGRGTTYTARNGNTFGVFTGGGFGGATDIDACVWPSAPADKDCARHG